MGHFLDRIYCSKPLYNNIKLISSSIPTKHSMVIARPDSEFIIDQNKKRRTVYTRRRSPPQDCKALNLLANVDWSPVYIATSVQSAFDAFYVILHFIINLVYPSRRVTLTSRDPPYITPNIKFMLRRRNKMMRGGRVHEANALSVKIGAAIASFNSRQLSDIDLLKDGVGGAAISAMWGRVNAISGGGSFNSTEPPPPGISADALNRHYAAVSHDTSYASPLPRSSCSPPLDSS